MIAGAGPMPPTPTAARVGTASASADSATITRPNSAIDGMVQSGAAREPRRNCSGTGGDRRARRRGAGEPPQENPAGQTGRSAMQRTTGRHQRDSEQYRSQYRDAGGEARIEGPEEADRAPRD